MDTAAAAAVPMFQTVMYAFGAAVTVDVLSFSYVVISVRVISVRRHRLLMVGRNDD